MSLDRLSSEELAAIAEAGRRDYWFFLRYIIGSAIKDPRYIPYERPHGEMAKEAQMLGTNGIRFMLQLWPRETWKSVVFTQAYSLWRLIRNPETRILILNASLDNALLFLRWIDQQVRGNELFRALYGDIRGTPWLTEVKNVKGHNPMAKEYSLQISSMGRSVVSRHFDLIIADDLINDEWVGSETRVQATIEYVRNLFDMVTADGQMLFVGTRWDSVDLYGWLIEEHANDPDWRLNIRGVYNDDGSLLWPEHYPEERIRQLRRDKGERSFSLQYLNRPLADDDEKLPDPVFYEGKEPPCVKYILVDPAISKKETADKSAIVCIGQTYNDELYVIEYDTGHYTPYELVDRILDMAHRQRPKLIGIESTAFQQALIFMMEDAMRRRGRRWRVEALKADKEKRRRILQLEPHLSRGAFFVRPYMTELIQQLKEFPNNIRPGNHYDLLDACAYIMQVKRKATTRAQRTYRRQPVAAVGHSKTGI